MKTLRELLGESLTYRMFLGHTDSTVSTLRRNALLFLKWLEFNYYVVTADRLRKIRSRRFRRAFTRGSLPA